MFKKIDMVKPFEFILSINDNIICQRYFNVKGYNEECRESLEIKEMMDDIMGTKGYLKLGVIPEFLKYQSIVASYKAYESDVVYSEKDDIFKFKVIRNNSGKLKKSNEEFTIETLEKELLIEGYFDGKLFHPTVRYDINIKPIISDITRIITTALSRKNYTKVYGDVYLRRHNKLSPQDLERITQ